VLRRSERAFPIERVVRGEVTARDAGSVFVAETVFDPRGRGAHVPGPHFLDHAGETLVWLTGASELGGIRADEVLFLDLETTGFGGAGIYPFLIGVAFYRGSVLHVQQLFMLGPGHEAALLGHFLELTERFRYLASFNGRTFDVHVLEDRFTLHRMRCALLGAPHFDVLFPSRQLWKGRYENCRLTTLERQVLGIRRGRDVESGLIPALYHHYVRSGETHGMAAIFRHNCQDLLSLVALSAALLRSCQGQEPPGQSDEALALGLMHLRQGSAEVGRRCLETALSRPGGSALRSSAFKALSLHCKRAGEHDRAVSLWQQMVAEYPLEPFAYEELAKWYEHAVGDPGQALHWTRTAASRLGPLPRFQRRLQRLSRRPWAVQLTLF
jgi:hypothetical protein